MHNSLGALTQRRGVRQFVKFSVVGASGLFVNAIIAHALHGRTNLSDFTDFAIGFMAGGVSNYVLNRIWTFRSDRNALIEGAQFLTVSLIALLFGKLVFWLAGRAQFDHFTTIWFVATAAGVLVNFFLNKYWTFKHVS
ncbi:MAG: GtrA family protein [Vulcanimicrobiaceae bacterium]